MKKLGEITMTQRTALGHDNAGLSVFGVILGYWGKEDISIKPINDAKEFIKYNNHSKIIGTYDVVHPCIMAGNWDEINSDFIRYIKEDMETKRLVVANDYGTLFLRK